MKLVIWRGTHEIGGSCVEVASKNSRIIIDIGMPLCDQVGQKFDMRDHENKTGLQLIRNGILPDIRGLYQWDTENKLVDAVLLSHAHMDHYGFLQFINDRIPCYHGAATKALIDINILLTKNQTFISRSRTIQSGRTFARGDFQITPYLMDHSAFDAYSYVLEAEGKKIIYSGDFRDHGRKPQTLQNFIDNAPKSADALLLEGTMFGRTKETVQTENDIEQTVIQAIRENNGIILLCLSAQNIDRIVSLYRAALKTRKLFVIDVYTAFVLETIKDYAKIPYPSNKYDNIRVFYPYRLSRRIGKIGQEQVLYKFRTYKITRDEIQANQNNIMMMVRASMVSDLEKISLDDAGTLIYSMWDGYLRDDSLNKLTEYAAKKHMKLQSIHTSGHASIETLKKVVNALAPLRIIPIHTLHPGQYNIFDREVIILADGLELEL